MDWKAARSCFTTNHPSEKQEVSGRSSKLCCWVSTRCLPKCKLTFCFFSFRYNSLIAKSFRCESIKLREGQWLRPSNRELYTSFHSSHFCFLRVSHFIRFILGSLQQQVISSQRAFSRCQFAWTLDNPPDIYPLFF